MKWASTEMESDELLPELQLLFTLKPDMDWRRYNDQRTNEVAAVFYTSVDREIPESYVTIRNKNIKTLQKISIMDPNVEPWIYPLWRLPQCLAARGLGDAEWFTAPPLCGASAQRLLASKSTHKSYIRGPPAARSSSCFQSDHLCSASGCLQSNIREWVSSWSNCHTDYQRRIGIFDRPQRMRALRPTTWSGTKTPRRKSCSPRSLHRRRRLGDHPAADPTGLLRLHKGVPIKLPFIEQTAHPPFSGWPNKNIHRIYTFLDHKALTVWSDTHHDLTHIKLVTPTWSRSKKWTKTTNRHS